MKRQESVQEKSLGCVPSFSHLDAREDIEIYVQCFELILGSLEERLAGLSLALQNLDLTDVSFSAHQLKGGFLLAGAHDLAETCEQIIGAANRQEVQFANALTARLLAARAAFENELSISIVELREKMSTMSNGPN
jgi:hypothetical protein